MSITSELTDNDDTLVINIDGRFDFSVHTPFRNAYRNQPDKKAYNINLEKVEHIDSAAFGMLLLFREFVGEDKCLRLLNPQPTVKRSLEIAMFDQLFEVR